MDNYILYLVLSAVFGWLCYHVGYAIGSAEEFERCMRDFLPLMWGIDDE